MVGQDGSLLFATFSIILLCWLTGTPAPIGPALMSPRGFVSNNYSCLQDHLVLQRYSTYYGGLSRSFLYLHILFIIFPVLSYLFSLNRISTVCFCLSMFLQDSIISLSLFCSNMGHVTRKCWRSSSSRPQSLHTLSWFLFLLCIYSSTWSVFVLALAKKFELILFV